jgi:hypothetical protein
MRQNTLILASVVLAATGFGATSAAAQEEYRHGHLRHVEAGVTLQRATEAMAEEAVPNLPFLPGDRVWTDATGRVEFQFPEGTVVRLDCGSKLDYSDHDESRDERVVLRLWAGSVILRARAPESAIFEIETPGGLVEVMGPSVVRIDVEGGETQLSVYDGEASLDTGRDRVRLAAGERTCARWGDGPAEPAPFDRYAQDDFGQWEGELESQQAWAANSRRYLPRQLEPYAPAFDTHGAWAYEEPVGYVWQPRVAVGWTPYSNGRWIWTAYGWTWVPYEPWGWVPHHYGRWGFSVSLGWYWSPGTVWGGGWVSWGVGGGYVGWCALGWNNRPVYPWPHHRGWRGHPHRPRHPRGHAVPRGSVPHPHEGAWSVVRSDDLGRRGGGAHRRVNPARAGALTVAESIHDRPDRSGRAFTRASAVPRAARAHPRPGAASRASRGASPVPMGSAASRSGQAAASRSGGARPRGGAGSVAERSSPSSTRRGGSPPWVGSSRARRSGATARPSSSRRGAEALGSLFRSREGSGSAAASRSRGSQGGAASRRPGASTRGSERRPPSSVTPRPRSSPPRSGGVSTSPRSRPRDSGIFDRLRRSGSERGGAASRSRSSGSRPSGVSSRSRSGGSRPSGVSSRSRSGGSRPSGVSSRSRSGGSRSSGVSSRSRSGGSRSSGVSSRSRSGGSRPSGVSSRSRSGGSRPSGVSSRSRSSAPRSSGASRSRPSGGSRGSVSRSGARSRSGSRRN